MNTAQILLLALVLDAIFGEPEYLWSRLTHPAVLMGRIVGWLDARFNKGENRKLKGLAVVLGLCLVAGAIGISVSNLPEYGILQALIAAMLLAQKSLVQHVSAVADALRLSTADARLAVARIVGRDTSNLDDSAIARGAIESAAENLSDGVVAPAFWFLLLGLPGLLIYKIVNTADSMIGYLNDQYRTFGWATARLDDVLNWIPARLTAVLIAATHLRFDAWRIILRDAPLHRSPNAGWPEAAMAVVLNVALAGPRSYGGTLREFPFVHAQGRHKLMPDDIDASVNALWRVWFAICGLTALVAFFA